jgi:hypothetical protein
MPIVEDYHRHAADKSRRCVAYDTMTTARRPVNFLAQANATGDRFSPAITG